MKLLTAHGRALRPSAPPIASRPRCFADAPLDAIGAVERLYVQGGGDPALTSEDLVAPGRRPAPRRPAQRCEGGIVLDASLFDDERLAPELGKARLGARLPRADRGLQR